MQSEHIVNFQTRGRQLILDTFPWARLTRQPGGSDTVDAEVDQHIFLRLICNSIGGSGVLYTNEDALGRGTLAEEDLDPNEWSDFQGWMGIAFQTYAETRNNRLLIVNTDRIAGRRNVFLKPHESKISFDGGTWEALPTVDILHKLVFEINVATPAAPAPAAPLPVWKDGVREMNFKNPAFSRTKLASGQQPIDPSVLALVEDYLKK